MSYKIHFINANAGSGKTTFLVNKIFEYIQTGSLKNVLCLTFSNAGVKELMLRVYDRWQKEDIGMRSEWNDQLAQTLHSFCLNLLLQYNDNYKILTPDMKEILWQTSLNKTIEELDDNEKLNLVHISNLHLLEKYSNKNFKGELGKIQLAAKEKFLRYKELECWLDFDDILTHTKALLDSDVANEIIYDTLRNIQCLMIDEAQDLSQIQWEIVHNLIQELVQLPQMNVYVVGDEKQTIYGFQGAVSDNMVEFKKHYSQALEGDTNNKLIEQDFDHSYRCAQEILTLVDKIFGTKHISKNLEKGYVEFWDLILDQEEWMQRIVSSIQDLIINGFAYHDILILIRKRSEKYDKLYDLLQQNNIPVAYESHTHLMDLLYNFSMLCCLSNDTDNPKYQEQCNFYSYNILSNKLIENELSNKNIIALMMNQKHFLDIIKNNLWLGQLYIKCMMTENNPLNLVKTLLDCLLEKGYIHNNLILDILESLALYITKTQANLYSCAHFLKNYRLSPKANAVRIQTVHSTKGQEAKAVFVCDTTVNPNLAPLDEVSTNENILLADDEMYESSKMLLRDKSLKEHHRLLYVALTRAKTHLFIVNFNTSEKISENSWYKKMDKFFI